MREQLTPKYSGKESTKFWKQINTIKNEHKRNEAYTLGVVLQNIEENIITLINLLK